MKAEEGKFKKEMVENLIARNCYIKVTHGNQFQAGLPDLYILNHHGISVWVECKAWTKSYLPLGVVDILGQLKGAQINVIKYQMWTRNAACFIASIVHDTDEVAICYKDKFCIASIDYICRAISLSRTNEEVLQNVIPY